MVIVTDQVILELHKLLVWNYLHSPKFFFICFWELLSVFKLRNSIDQVDDLLLSAIWVIQHFMTAHEELKIVECNQDLKTKGNTLSFLWNNEIFYRL